MVRLNAKFHTRTRRRRDGDMVWRIPRRDGTDTYLLLLLEFQPRSDIFMAVRVLTYAGLLWQQLVSEKRLVARRGLPPVLPVVIYNGRARWSAPESIRDLIRLPERSPLWRWQPELRYYLIDTGSLSQVDLAMRDELPSLWFRMEKAANTAAMVAAVDARLAWLERHPGYADIRAVFADLLGDLIAPLGPELKVPEDLMEVRNMLATRAEQWVKQWQREGRRKGLAEGRQEGRREGLEEGRQEGRQEGEAALLLRLLERRFGTLPGWVMDRVRGAETGVLEEWGLRVLDARSIEDIFGAPPA